MITTTARATVLADIADWSAYRLANEAECFGPDSLDSEGAQFLERVRNAVLDIDGIGEMSSDDLDTIDDDGTLGQIADDAPSVYTFTKWRQFVDIGAWQEDVSELSEDTSDIDSLASLALNIIADRLARVIVEAIAESAREDEDTDTDDDSA